MRLALSTTAATLAASIPGAAQVLLQVIAPAGQADATVRVADTASELNDGFGFCICASDTALPRAVTWSGDMLVIAESAGAQIEVKLL